MPNNITNIAMPTVYLRKDLYDRIIKAGDDVASFVNKAVEAKLKPAKKEKKK
ncbi:hypothetical protein ES703_36779 [subsurface metagenome]